MGGRQPIRRAPEIRRTESTGIVVPHGDRPSSAWEGHRPRVPVSLVPDVEIGAPFPEVVRYQIPEFQAWTVCPQCGRWDLHWMTPPWLDAPRVISVEVESDDYTERVAWGYGSIQIMPRMRTYTSTLAKALGESEDPEARERYLRGHYLLDRHDERSADVVRRCRNLDCQFRWPQGPR